MYKDQSSAVGESSNDSVTIGQPATTADGDLMCYLAESHGETVSWGFTPGAGETGVFTTDGNSGRPTEYRWATRIAESEPASRTITIGGGNGIRAKATCVVLSGRASAVPSALQATSNNAGSSVTPISTVLAGLTAASGDDIVIVTGAASTNMTTGSAAFAAPTNYTTRATASTTAGAFDRGGVAIATRDNVSAGATGALTGSWSLGTGHADTAGVVLAFAAAGGGGDGDAEFAGNTATHTPGTMSANGGTGRSITLTLSQRVGDSVVPLNEVQRRFWTRSTLDGAAVDGSSAGIAVTCNNVGVFVVNGLTIEAGDCWLMYKDAADDMTCHMVPVTAVG